MTATAPREHDAASHERAVAVGAELAVAFRNLIEAFPSEARTVSQMSRWLGIMRPNCQRVVLGLRVANDPMELLQRFPGVKGLNQFVTAAAQQGIDSSLIENTEQAVNRYADLINDFGGTQSRLTAVLAKESVGAADNDKLEDRQSIRKSGFEFAASTAGYQCAARLEIALVRVMPADPTRLEVVIGSGLIGAIRKPLGMPLCRMHRSIGQAPHVGSVATLDGQPPIGLRPNALIPQFSSPDVPCVSRRLDDDWMIEVFHEESADAAPIDLVIANHHAPACEHPALTRATIYNRGVLIGVPARHLVMDVYMERPLAKAGIISSGVYFTGMKGGVGHNRPETRWFDRIPEEPPIENLGVGTRKSATASYRRHAELTAHLFNAAGWNPERFVGYRCEAAFPIWGAEYLMSFDFAEDREDDGSRCEHA